MTVVESAENGGSYTVITLEQDWFVDWFYCQEHSDHFEAVRGWQLHVEQAKQNEELHGPYYGPVLNELVSIPAGRYTALPLGGVAYQQQFEDYRLLCEQLN